ncbi:hypothetical protein VTJ04DRAFT_8943 [Mycothermus thermophilus]|uniref:uncharacterized protein n=1 Tax=Humicola insolens TaxID=85995 RepID=UPI0037423E92
MASFCTQRILIKRAMVSCAPSSSAADQEDSQFINCLHPPSIDRSSKDVIPSTTVHPHAAPYVTSPLLLLLGSGTGSRKRGVLRDPSAAH